MRLKFSIRSLAGICMTLLILFISTCAFIFWREYQTTISSALRENSLSLEHAYVWELLQEMDDVSGEVLYALPHEMDTTEAHFLELYERAQSYLGQLMEQVDGARYYAAYDISKMLSTYRQEFETYHRTVAEAKTASVYLRGMRTDLKTLNGYIKDELGSAIAYHLDDSKESIRGASQALVRTKNHVLFFGVICILACIFLLELLFRMVMRPIADLSERMDSFKRTDRITPARPAALRLREMCLLSESFDSMATEIQQKQESERRFARLEMKNMEMKYQLDKARLDLLQAQVNPHFLFNTLNAIYALTLRENAAASGEMIAYLSSILRYTLSSLSSFVRVGHELEILSDYIHIQKLRFGDAIRFNVEAEPELEDAEIPCMLIQPLMENAIMHAFNPPGPSDQVDVLIRRAGDCILVEVRDNGAGMSGDQLERIRSGETRSASEPDQHHGIGLDSVLKRMDILYGPDSVRIESRPGFGTRITLILSETTQMEE